MSHPNHTTASVRATFTKAREQRLARKRPNVARHPALIEALAKRGRVWGEGNKEVMDQIRDLARDWAQGKWCVPSGVRPAPGWRKFYFSNNQSRSPESVGAKDWAAE